MKNILTLFFVCITLSLSMGCKERQTCDSELSHYSDSIFVNDFYKSIKGLSIEDIEKSTALDLSQIDSVFYITYSTPINGYSVKAVLKEFERSGFNSYIGSAYIFFTDSCITRKLLHPVFSLSDSIAERLKRRTINIIDYNINYDSYYNTNQLGQFRGLPFAFFDVDFDGNNELLLRFPFVGQRFRSAYSPLRESSTEINSFDDAYVYTSIDSTLIESEEYSYYPILDDMTEFDYNKRELIVYISAGWIGNEKLYYNVNNKVPTLCKKEVYYCGYDTLAKRINYTLNGTIVEYFNNAEKYGIR